MGPMINSHIAVCRPNASAMPPSNNGTNRLEMLASDVTATTATTGSVTGNPPVTIDHVQVISGNYCYLGIFPFCGKFIEYFDRRKNCIDIRVLGIGKCQCVCCIQAGFPANRRALDFCFPADIIVPVNTQDQCPSLGHYVIYKIAVNLLNYSSR